MELQKPREGTIVRSVAKTRHKRRFREAVRGGDPGQGDFSKMAGVKPHSEWEVKKKEQVWPILPTEERKTKRI